MFTFYAQVNKPVKHCEIFECRKNAVWAYQFHGIETKDYYCDEHKPKIELL